MKEYHISACGKKIFITEATKKHLLAHPDVLEFLEEAISKIKIKPNQNHFQEAINLGRIIGISMLVNAKQISSEDETDFALRIERKWPSRISLKSRGQSCDSVALEIRLDEKINKYFLSTAYIGHPCPYEPCYIADKSSKEFREALNFWCGHALAYNSEIMSKPFRSNWDQVLKN